MNNQSNAQLADFKTWLLSEYINTEPPESGDYFTEFVLKVRIDNHWPTGRIAFTQFMSYLDGHGADDITKVQLVIAWSRYVSSNAPLITSLEILGWDSLAKSHLRNFLLNEDKVLFNNTLKWIKAIEAACFESGSIENGISWKSRL